MTMRDAASWKPIAPIDAAGLNAEQDRLILSLAKSMTQEYFPELLGRGKTLSMETAPRIDPGFCQQMPDLSLVPPPCACGCDDGFETSPLAYTPQCVPEESPRNRFNVQSIRKDFPILAEKVNGCDLVWFDNAATTQKPRSVTERLVYFYEHENSNVHRAAHTLAARATDAYEDARAKVAAFLNAGSAEEIVFVRGATEGINLVANAYGLQNLKEGDEVIVSMMEHHANIVPWQMVCERQKAKLKVIPVDETGQIILPAFERLLSPKTKLVALTQISNALGTQAPVAQMVKMAHQYGAKVFVDGAQAVAHVPADVKALDCDFYVFSGHKVFGPLGIGVLYGKLELLNAMPPYQGGGSMISNVAFEKSSYKPSPYRFEAGTGSIADAVGLGAAIDYITRVGLDRIARYERQLYAYGAEALQTVDGLHLIGTAKHKVSILPFTLEGFTPEEVGEALNRNGIAVRTGHHCAQPVLKAFGLDSVVRVSLAMYNTREEIDQLVAALKRLKQNSGHTRVPLHI